MKIINCRFCNFFAATCFVIATLSSTSVNAQTIYDGPSIAFTKSGSVDHTLPENQDQITSNVSLTRASTRGLFNIINESLYDKTTNIAPTDTEWAYGTTNDIGSLTFQNWFTWHGGSPASSVGQDAVLHLISDDTYIDIKFTNWGNSGSGGSFSYERSTPSVPEPSSWLLAGLGLVSLFVLRKKRTC